MEDLFIEDSKFYCPQYCIYPPFKNGYYLEEYFYDYMHRKGKTRDRNNRLYIPAFWTAMQIEGWFPYEKQRLQEILNKYIDTNPSPGGYFTIVQHDDGVMFDLPSNTLIYGACTGNIFIPLIYQDTRNTLLNLPRISYQNKNIFCSFVGTITHPIRNICYNELHINPKYEFYMKNEWSNSVNSNLQDLFIEKTRYSKFALAPRGYGRSSFRFYEIFQLGTIPIYVWDDTECLPYMEFIDYSKFCISIHESKINLLDEILTNIDEVKYQEMLNEYQKIKNIFELEFMCNYITQKI